MKNMLTDLTLGATAAEVEGGPTPPCTFNRRWSRTMQRGSWLRSRSGLSSLLSGIDKGGKTGDSVVSMVLSGLKSSESRGFPDSTEGGRGAGHRPQTELARWLGKFPRLHDSGSGVVKNQHAIASRHFAQKEFPGRKGAGGERGHSYSSGEEDEAAAIQFMKMIGYKDEVAQGIIRALKQPGSGLPAGALHGMVQSMAGRWEVGEDAGLRDLARAVEVELAQSMGKVAVRFEVVVPHAGGRRFECEGLEGMTLRDVREHGGMEGGEELGEYLECACSGVMACSTCHVIVDPAWYQKFEPPDDAEQDMIDLAYEPQETSRLGCQLKLSKANEGFVISIPPGANNLFDHIPFEDQ